MNTSINILFLIKIFKINKVSKCNYIYLPLNKSIFFFESVLSPLPQKKLKKFFLKKSMFFVKVKTFKKLKPRKRVNVFFFLNRFVIMFLESFFKNKIIFNIKKGSNKLVLRQMSFRKFTAKYFKRTLKTSKQIIGVIYYALLLKDSRMFVVFFKKIIEKLNVKLHKKLFLGLKKILKDFFKPVFAYLGVLGIFFNVRGKVGVSGSAKKRRYFFYFGRHSITSRNMKMDLNFSPV